MTWPSSSSRRLDRLSERVTALPPAGRCSCPQATDADLARLGKALHADAADRLVAQGMTPDEHAGVWQALVAREALRLLDESIEQDRASGRVWRCPTCGGGAP